MSIKTLAVDVNVYKKLSGLKRESESFSKALERLMERGSTARTGAAILGRLGDQAPALTDREAEAMLRVVAAHRASERWKQHDLR